jgi:hypothetical protein
MTSDLLGVEHHPCATAAEFLTALDPAQPLWERVPHDQDGRSTHGWIFRGQPDDEPLVPTALRRDAEEKFAQVLGARRPPLDQLRLEYWTLLEFITATDAAGLPIPNDGPDLRVRHRLERLLFPDGWFGNFRNWPPDEVLSVLGLAQHYGLPTRLLDWTRRTLVAAYFAASTVAKRERSHSCDDALVVWALNLECIRDLWRGEVSHLPGTTKRLIEGEPTPRIVLVEAPQATNPNLAAQAGLFVLDRKATSDVGLERALPLHFVERLRPFRTPEEALRASGYTHVFRKITLPHRQARPLLHLLGRHGVTASSVYPGHKGVVDSLYEKHFWEPSPWFAARPRSPIKPSP